MQDVQLRRVVLDDVGKPRREYRSPQQLVRAMRMAFVAHRGLRSPRTSHPDVHSYSAPSLERGEFSEEREVDAEKTEGSLAGVDCATLPFSDSHSEGPSTTTSDGETMETGTAAFMASSLLWGDLHGAKPGEAVASRTETPAADIESFAWVFVFVVYRYALENFTLDQDQRKDLREEFYTLFPCPGSSAETVLHARYIMRLPGSNQHILRHIQDQVEHPDHFCDLFSSIWEEILVGQLPSVNTAKHSLLRTQIVKRARSVPTQAPQPLELVHDDLLGFLEGYLGLVGEPLQKQSLETEMRDSEQRRGKDMS